MHVRAVGRPFAPGYDHGRRGSIGVLAWVRPPHGIPIGIKDLCWTNGVRTMGGLAVRRGLVPQEDATVVTRLRTAGAVAPAS